MKTSILFLCTGNSCRSQMAEGWLRYLKKDQYDAFSAGIEAHGLNPDAVKVMAEAGIDISKQHSKLLESITVTPDIVVSVCSNADETCPVLPVLTKRIFRGFDDPPKLALDAETEDERLESYRRVRDEIKQFVENIEQLL